VRLTCYILALLQITQEPKVPADKNYLSDVRDQYENLPYPPRDPEAENQRLVPTFTDYLEKINHYGFAGRQTFKKGFRCLVAGGGTGDSTVFLAEQLRNKPNVEIVHLDLSSASIEVARQRTRIRDLDNTRFIQGSILDLTAEEHGMFDFISCTGVLHHLDNPADGLRCLTGVLAKDGLMGLMLYGEYGRLGIYPIQDMLGYLKRDVPAKKDQIELGKSVLAQIPATHTFKSHNKIWEQETALYGDEGFYDLFLHSQDRAYNVPEIYDLVEDCGLKIRHLGLTHGSGGAYDPALYISDRHVLDKVVALPTREQQHIAEILNGNMYMHGFFAAFEAKGVASIENKRSVPFFYPEVMDQLAFANRSGPHP
jgi:ubiquinone/menaquinone biosynthesis C-methylase UbiE